MITPWNAEPGALWGDLPDEPNYEDEPLAPEMPDYIWEWLEEFRPPEEA